MKNRIMFSVAALVFVSGSIFAFANSGVSNPTSKGCGEICTPFCCDDKDGSCDPSTCDYSACLKK